VLTIQGGDDGRNVSMSLLCDNSVVGVGLPQYINESPMLTYNFQWRSPYACAVGNPCGDVQTEHDIVGSDSPSSPHLLGAGAISDQCCAACKLDEGTNVFVFQPSNGNCWCKYLDPTVQPTDANDRVFGRHGGVCSKRVNADITAAGSGKRRGRRRFRSAQSSAARHAELFLARMRTSTNRPSATAGVLP